LNVSSTAGEQHDRQESSMTDELELNELQDKLIQQLYLSLETKQEITENLINKLEAIIKDIEEDNVTLDEVLNTLSFICKTYRFIKGKPDTVN
jgi:hypothetical protein